MMQLVHRAAVLAIDLIGGLVVCDAVLTSAYAETSSPP
jgi:hypothetical protein